LWPSGAAEEKHAMPKMKTRKCAAKRVKLSSRGKVTHASTGRGHLLSSKSRKQKRRLRKGNTLSATDQKRIRALL
jgi:large subunit ribosomal protein L35